MALDKKCQVSDIVEMRQEDQEVQAKLAHALNPSQHLGLKACTSITQLLLRF